jgi:hypothetical protein
MSDDQKLKQQEEIQRLAEQAEERRRLAEQAERQREIANERQRQINASHKDPDEDKTIVRARTVQPPIKK